MPKNKLTQAVERNIDTLVALRNFYRKSAKEEQLRFEELGKANDNLKSVVAELGGR